MDCHHPVAQIVLIGDFSLVLYTESILILWFVYEEICNFLNQCYPVSSSTAGSTNSSFWVVTLTSWGHDNCSLSVCQVVHQSAVSYSGNSYFIRFHIRFPLVWQTGFLKFELWRFTETSIWAYYGKTIKSKSVQGRRCGRNCNTMMLTLCISLVVWFFWGVFLH